MLSWIFWQAGPSPTGWMNLCTASGGWKTTTKSVATVAGTWAVRENGRKHYGTESRKLWRIPTQELQWIKTPLIAFKVSWMCGLWTPSKSNGKTQLTFGAWLTAISIPVNCLRTTAIWRTSLLPTSSLQAWWAAQSLTWWLGTLSFLITT